MTTVPVTTQERIPMPPAVARRPAGPAAAAGLTFADVLRILKQRMFLVIFIWFFVTGLAAAATWYLQKNHQMFRSQVLIKVDSPNPRDPFEVREPMPPVELLNRYVMDQVQLVQQREVLDAALRDPKVTGTRWYQEHKQKGELTEAIEDDLSVSPVPGQSYLQVRFTARNPKEAAEIADTIADKYIDAVKLASTTMFSTELSNYRSQLRDLETDLETTRKNMEDYIGKSIGVPGVVEGINVASEQWRVLATEYAKLDAEQVQLKAALDSYQRMDPDEAAITPQMMMNIQQDPMVMGLNNVLVGYEQQYRSLIAQGAGPQNRDVKRIQSAIQVAQAMMTELIQRKEQEIRQFQQSSIQTAWLNALNASLQLQNKVSEFEAKQRDIDAKMARFRSMEDTKKSLERQVEKGDDFARQLELLVTGQQTVRVRKLGKAELPLRPSFPRWELNMPVGSFLGLLLGIGMALLLELANTSIRTPRDVVRHIHTPILGTVPDLDDEEVHIERMELAAHAAPRSMIAEAFRTIRTNLMLSSPAERQRTVMITSSKPEEGKTSIATNLAISIGQSGRRVLLVDANFHRPTLHTLFTQAKREGLSNILIGRGKLADFVSTTQLPNLDVLACGPIPPNPTELLTSRHMSELLNEAAQRYDQVILDGPPVLLVSDALVLASAVDGVILVCRAKTASRGTVQRAREQLDRVNARLFGAVLNAAQVARGGYFREQMRSYYEYQPEEALLTGGSKALPREDGGDSA